jgi:hypothetical protein
MAQRKWTEKDEQIQQKKERWRTFPGTGQRVIEQILFDQSEDSCLAQQDCADSTQQLYTPNSVICSEPCSYENSWV